jgi:hypothetical protein
MRIRNTARMCSNLIPVFECTGKYRYNWHRYHTVKCGVTKYRGTATGSFLITGIFSLKIARALDVKVTVTISYFIFCDVLTNHL